MVRKENWQVIYLDEIDSTNNYLKAIVEERSDEDDIPHESIAVVADLQTGGRGQRGNSWFAKKGADLLFSLLIYPHRVLADASFVISQAVSLAVVNALVKFVPDVCIKWPNDIYWHDKKLGGILIENELRGCWVYNSILGVGLNINERDFPNNLPNPISLYQITGLEFNRDDILKTILDNFDALLERLTTKAAVEKIDRMYLQKLYRRFGNHMFEDSNGMFEAHIDGVLPSGHLLLCVADTGELREYEFKEVQFVI